MLRHGGNDGNVVLGVAGVQQGVEAPGPGRNLARQREDRQAQADDARNADDEALEEEVEVVQGKGHASADIVDEDKGISIVPSVPSSRLSILY